MSQKERGFLKVRGAFIREAIRNEITGREAELTEVEQRLAATMERLSRDTSCPLRPAGSFCSCGYASENFPNMCSVGGTRRYESVGRPGARSLCPICQIGRPVNAR